MLHTSKSYDVINQRYFNEKKNVVKEKEKVIIKRNEWTPGWDQTCWNQGALTAQQTQCCSPDLKPIQLALQSPSKHVGLPSENTYCKWEFFVPRKSSTVCLLAQETVVGPIICFKSPAFPEWEGLRGMPTSTKASLPPAEEETQHPKHEFTISNPLRWKQTRIQLQGDTDIAAFSCKDDAWSSGCLKNSRWNVKKWPSYF